MNPHYHNLAIAKKALREELQKFGFTEAGITAISKHVARYTATAIRLDRSTRREPNQLAEVVDTFFNRRPAPPR